MSSLNKTGLRLAAAGAAAALALAAGAPAFAQETAEEENPVDTTSSPAVDEGSESPATDETSSPATEDPEGDSEVEDDKDPAGEEEVPEEDLPETPADDDEEWEDVYSYAYLDDVLEGANVGESVLAEPQFRIDGESLLEDPAATVLVFTDSTSLESIFSGEDWELTYHAYANALYDNCVTEEWGVTCLVEFAPEVGKTYGLSDESPLYYDIIDEVDDDDAAAYYAWDIDAEELDGWIADGYSLGGENNLSLVETAEIEDGGYFNDFGLFYFQADLVLPEFPTGEPELPTTGNSSIILISSAAAALLAGAVVFYLMRRRKTAANW